MMNFYTCAPVCTPSRAAMLTGWYPIRSQMSLPLYPPHHPMEYCLKAVDRYQYDVTGIPSDGATLTEILQRGSNRTGLVGKWHLEYQPRSLPVWRNEEIEVPAPAEQNRMTYDYTQVALEFIETHKDKPFFLYLSHTVVH